MRQWEPDIGMIADQLIADARDETKRLQGFADGLSTLQSWRAHARAHGDDLNENDLVSLVLELADRCAGGDGINWQNINWQNPRGEQP
jgi:hypothetical protein